MWIGAGPARPRRRRGSRTGAPRSLSHSGGIWSGSAEHGAVEADAGRRDRATVIIDVVEDDPRPSPTRPPWEATATRAANAGAVAATQEAAVWRARPRAVLVGTRAAGARADEARPPAPSLPGQVRPPARRGAARALRSGRAAASRPVRRARARRWCRRSSQPRRRWRRRRRVQRAADAGQDPPLRPRALATSTAATGAAARPRGRQPDAASCAAGTRRRPPGAARISARSIPGPASADVLRVVLARAARSARRTTHFDLDFPREPQRASTGATSTAGRAGRSRARGKFLARYLADTAARDRGVRRRPRQAPAAVVLHGDARELELGGPYDAVITSPPYPGLIDYHEQHRYAYELLGLDDRRERELGRAARGTSKAAVEEYVAGIAAVLARSRRLCAAARRSASSSTTGASSIPEILRPRRPATRRAARAARQSPHRAARGRVLRVDPDLPLAAYQPSYRGLPPLDLVPVVAVVDGPCPRRRSGGMCAPASVSRCPCSTRRCRHHSTA